ncbi:MAG: lamin tail domain-containing protein, partial [Candidatus Eremiobacteraeota bacterium]|nr:lamin tail domain-containing protein [Candidatus Eremiobacteraeota bacterium]
MRPFLPLPGSGSRNALARMLRAAVPLVVLSACASSDHLVSPPSAARLAANAAGGGVVVSQVYGGGGNSGATYINDVVELYNAGPAAVSVSGWSVQYASSSGSSWQVTLLAGTIQPGSYYLVQEAAGAGGTTPLPTPDANSGIAMSSSAGKIAFVNTATALSGACPLS